MGAHCEKKFDSVPTKITRLATPDRYLASACRCGAAARRSAASGACWAGRTCAGGVAAVPRLLGEVAVNNIATASP